MSSAAAPLAYDPALDGLRAVAAVAVIVFHTSAALPGGWIGVDLFFVLSGYLITRLLSCELARQGAIDLRRFYIRRFLRLNPAFACLIGFVLLRAGFSHGYRSQLLWSAATAATYVMNWAMAFSPSGDNLLLHTWSLATEEQFYLLWPAILPLIAGRRPLLPIAAGIGAVIAWRLHLVAAGAPFERTYFGFDTHADALLIGCAAALVPALPRLRRRARASVGLPLLVLALMALTFDLQSIRSQTAGLTLAALCAAWIVLALEDGPSPLRTVLSCRPLVYTGKLSYALYLWHYPFYFIVRRHCPDVLPAGVPTLLAFGCFPLAMASYHVVERPFLRLKARFEPARTDAGRPIDSLAPQQPFQSSALLPAPSRS